MTISVEETYILLTKTEYQVSYRNAVVANRKWRLKWEVRMRDLGPRSPDFTRAPSSVDGAGVSRH